MNDRTRRWLGIGRFLAMLACVLVIARTVEIRSVGTRLLHLDLRFIAAFMLLSLPLYLLSAWRWHFTAARVGAPLRFRRAYLEYYLSTLLNQVLPVGVAGDIVRTTRHRLALGSWGPPVRAVMLERFSGFFALVLFVVASALVWLSHGRNSFTLVGARALLLVAVAALVLFAGASRWPWFQKLVHDARAAYFERGALVFQLAVSSAHVAILMLMFACAARAAGVVLGVPAILQVVPLVLLAMTVPWAFAGWGAREALAAALFSWIGLDAATGVAASITFGLLSLAAAAPGLIVLCLPRGES